jgi:hypothetical protein
MMAGGVAIGREDGECCIFDCCCCSAGKISANAAGCVCQVYAGQYGGLAVNLAGAAVNGMFVNTAALFS